MIAKAPGKLVLAGAYAVLEGAPALVTAVDRYVLADAARPAELETEEVRAAIAAGALSAAPWFDASELRLPLPDGGSRKLGIGSSAAILVASLGAFLGQELRNERALRAAVFEPALAAHRAAQGGGSGIDVAASVFGGVLRAQIGKDGALCASEHHLPAGLILEVFRSEASAVTRGLVARVHQLRHDEPKAYGALIARIADASEAAISADSARAFIAATDRGAEALGSLGAASGTPILPAAFLELRALALAETAAFCPSGAGGGDVSLFAGIAPSSVAFRALARARGFEPVDVRAGARGLHLPEISKEPAPPKR